MVRDMLECLALLGCLALGVCLCFISRGLHTSTAGITADREESVTSQREEAEIQDETDTVCRVAAIEDPGFLYQNLSTHNTEDLPGLGVGITISSKTYSKSGKEPFTVQLQLANLTGRTLALSNAAPIMKLSYSATNGPVIRFREDSIRGVIAQYRIEVCYLEELGRLTLGSETMHRNWKSFKALKPRFCTEHTAWVNNVREQPEDWCLNLQGKLSARMRYKVEIDVSDRLPDDRSPLSTFVCEDISFEDLVFDVVG